MFNPSRLQFSSRRSLFLTQILLEGGRADEHCPPIPFAVDQNQLKTATGIFPNLTGFFVVQRKDVPQESIVQ